MMKEQMSGGADHFSAIAKRYAEGRIEYPTKLYDFLANLCMQRELAWDCATGSGQAVKGLVDNFKSVIASDMSEELLKHTPMHPRVIYKNATAENSGIAASSVDLIVVAQAYHWFELGLFWKEAFRVLKDSGIVAIWGYTWPEVSSEVDSILESFKKEISFHWPVRSALLHREYVDVPVPTSFHELNSPRFEIELRWNLHSYLSHLRSWSAVRYYEESTGEDLVARFEKPFAEAFGRNSVKVIWPLVLRTFQKLEE